MMAAKLLWLNPCFLRLVHEHLAYGTSTHHSAIALYEVLAGRQARAGQGPTTWFAAIGPTERLCVERPWLGSQRDS